MRIGDRLIAGLTPGGDGRPPPGGDPPQAGARGGDGTRWADARRHSASPPTCSPTDPQPSLSAETAVLKPRSPSPRRPRPGACPRRAPLASPGERRDPLPALELLGRVRRATRPRCRTGHLRAGARHRRGAGLAVWRLRALHELGTIDMFDHAGHRPPDPGPAHRRRTRRGQHGRGHRPAAHRDSHVPVRARTRPITTPGPRLAASDRLGLGTTRAIRGVFLPRFARCGGTG